MDKRTALKSALASVLALTAASVAVVGRLRARVKAGKAVKTDQARG